MTTVPLHVKQGHLFVELEGELWLHDTGSPGSFGNADRLLLAGQEFALERGFRGINAEDPFQMTGVRCCGLLGTNILARFDQVIDCVNGLWGLSSDSIAHGEVRVPISEIGGIPVLTAQVSGEDYRMFFDTGAQVSYFQSASIATFPFVERAADFYPGYGRFETDVHRVACSIGGRETTLLCGTLPPTLAGLLSQTGVHGIVGNELLLNRPLGYFPTQGVLFL